MSLTEALVEGSGLRPHVEDGCRAIAAKHRGLIAEDLKQTIRNSLNLDAATRVQHEQANRWDYVLAVRGTNTLVGVEPHSARDDEVAAVIAKKQRSGEVLREHLKTGWYVSAWIWVSSGTLKFSKMDRARRRLNQHGIRFSGRIITSFLP